MKSRFVLLVATLLLGLPAAAGAAEGHGSLHVPTWTVIPFALTLLAIAVLPLVAEHWWHRNRNKALIAFVLSLPVVLYLLCMGETISPDQLPLGLNHVFDQVPTAARDVLQRAGTLALLHSVDEYVSFIVLLGALYTVSGGIVLHGDLRAGPVTNTLFLAVGAALANLIGTTGASMLLIRPYLNTNRQRQFTRHLPVFFIFLVSNLGGLLTPLGDPPLFLGFLRGVPFEWTLRLWPHWLTANGIVLAIFFLWDAIAWGRESAEAKRWDAATVQPLRLEGLVNLVFLVGIVAAVLSKSSRVSSAVLGIDRVGYWAEGVMVAMALLSWLCTPRRLRAANAFTWGPIVEVAVLFAGIFVTMVPALDLLQAHQADFNLTRHWQYFWLTGLLSSFLDNAPTYLVFGNLAAGGPNLGALIDHPGRLLQAISCGAVFMGANTYIGNGPNFMVKAIADANGFQTPSFFGYMLYSGGILLPVFALVTWLFFPPV